MVGFSGPPPKLFDNIAADELWRVLPWGESELLYYPKIVWPCGYVIPADKLSQAESIMRRELENKYVGPLALFGLGGMVVFWPFMSVIGLLPYLILLIALMYFLTQGVFRREFRKVSGHGKIVWGGVVWRWMLHLPLASYVTQRTRNDDKSTIMRVLLFCRRRLIDLVSIGIVWLAIDLLPEHYWLPYPYGAGPDETLVEIWASRFLCYALVLGACADLLGLLIFLTFVCIKFRFPTMEDAYPHLPEVRRRRGLQGRMDLEAHMDDYREEGGEFLDKSRYS